MFSAGTEKGAFAWDWLSEYLNILHIETLTATYQFLFNFYQFTKDPGKSSKWSSFSKTCFKVEFTFEFLLNFQERAPFENKGCLIECYTIIFGFFDTQTESRNILYLRLIGKLDLRGFQFLKGSENEFWLILWTTEKIFTFSKPSRSTRGSLIKKAPPINGG